MVFFLIIFMILVTSSFLLYCYYVYCRVTVFWLGLATDGIQAQRTQYNKFVESGFKSWALMGQRLVWKLGMIKQEIRTEPNGPTPWGKGLLIREYEFPPHTTSPRPAPLVRSLILYIPPFSSSSSYTCQSSMPILECTSHRPFLLMLCELLWPRQHCLDVTST